MKGDNQRQIHQICETAVQTAGNGALCTHPVKTHSELLEYEKNVRSTSSETDNLRCDNKP